MDVEVIRCLCGAKSADLIGYSKNVLEGFRRVSAERPRMVIVDARLAELEGLAMLRQSKRLVSRPLVIVIGREKGGPFAEACLSGGADHFFQLPLELHELGRTVSGLADKEHSDAVDEEQCR